VESRKVVESNPAQRKELKKDPYTKELLNGDVESQG
jgi:hypothetical protein